MRGAEIDDELPMNSCQHIPDEQRIDGVLGDSHDDGDGIGLLLYGTCEHHVNGSQSPPYHVSNPGASWPAVLVPPAGRDLSDVRGKSTVTLRRNRQVGSGSVVASCRRPGMANEATTDLHYRGWMIRCTPERIARGWCAVVEVWRPGRDYMELGARIPLTKLFHDAGDAAVEALEAGKRWIDARTES